MALFFARSNFINIFEFCKQYSYNVCLGKAYFLSMRYESVFLWVLKIFQMKIQSEIKT